MSKDLITTCPHCGTGTVFPDHEYSPDAGDGKAWAVMVTCKDCLWKDMPSVDLNEWSRP